MKRQSGTFMILIALIATSSCDTRNDLRKWKEAFDTNFETLDEENLNFQDSTNLANSKNVGSKNLISNVLNLVLSQIIPSLNNINIESLPLGPIGSLSNVVGKLDNPTVYPVEGSGTFNVKNLTLTFDRIALTGQYDIISLTLPGPIEIFGKGDFSVDLEEIRFTTGLTIKLVVSNLTITDFPDFNLSLKKSTIEFENLMGGGPVGELLNSIISDALPQLIEAAQGELIKNYGDEIANFLNPIINCMKSKPNKPLECLKPKK